LNEHDRAINLLQTHIQFLEKEYVSLKTEMAEFKQQEMMRNEMFREQMKKLKTPQEDCLSRSSKRIRFADFND
jgi:hypothetical protein